MYTHMAHYVAKVLHQNPADILDDWSVPALVVAYGIYANQESAMEFQRWKSLPQEQKRKYPQPEEYAVKFYSPADLEEGEMDGD